MYRHFEVLSVVSGDQDSSLDKPSMHASALQGEKQNKGLSIVMTQGSNHFISLEQPETIGAIPSLDGRNSLGLIKGKIA